MLEQPKKRANGRPVCSMQILFLIQEAGGKMKRSEIRKELLQMVTVIIAFLRHIRGLKDKIELSMKGQIILEIR